MLSKTSVTGMIAITGVTAGFIAGVAPDSIEPIKHFFSETAQSQIAQSGFSFALAAWIHSGRVKKEIKENFAVLTGAINNVADSLREELRSHSSEISSLSSRVTILEKQNKEA